ncbi:AAA-domain-containing protein [Dacryopinax primogenitus]|uniref:Vesicular-fusion protein SEC18 n=1 Tax=Dacryopinax primogenitus (strain DJM 731) TaxID=1858805 RepID=M5G8S0_DACPD|nr:AAA-domain-containing protein [Dacryopinax primogenitus]EJU06606.1 AAA-domain-containing protein [Dacryopinax primogenitus]
MWGRGPSRQGQQPYSYVPNDPPQRTSPYGNSPNPPSAPLSSNTKPYETPYVHTGYEKRGGGTHYAEPNGGGNSVVHVVTSPNDELALSNCVIVNPQEWRGVQYAYMNRKFPVKFRYDDTGKIHPGQVGCSSIQRQWMALSARGDQAELEPLNPADLGPSIYLGGLDLEVGFNLSKRRDVEEQFDSEDMARSFIRAFNELIISIGQILIWDYHGHVLKVWVKSLHVVDLGSLQPQKGQRARGGSIGAVGASSLHFGILNDQTDIAIMKAPDSAIKIRSSAKKAAPNAILAPNFKFEDMGIGGLDSEFTAIFRRAFASRVFPPGLVEKMGIQHVKGILLYGPPGTGKTLMARQIGKMLNAREPKIVNGPEILNKYVGASEENIRKLFADAEKEYKEKAEDSGLHIIIFDELDAICKQRGSTNNGTGVGDSVVNQLLSKMDGVDQLNNILIIGMTNRLDMIDEALLRPGRLEVHMEISLPDERGRLQILNIHTSKMRTNGVLDKDVDLGELAAVTKNFSGAEINGLIKSASSFAFNRHVKVGTMAGIGDDIEDLRVNRSDFLQALDEVHPLYGISEEELSSVVQNGIIHYDAVVDEILNDGRLFIEQVRTSQRTPLVSILLHGPPGSGKTALAATIAMASEFPFIKIISPDQMVGFSESQKIAAIAKTFSDSYKSPLSVIVVDQIERLIDWVSIGPRFSNGVVQTLTVLMGKRPPKERRLLVIATTSSRPLITEIEMADVFDSEIRVPPISDSKALDTVIRELKLFGSEAEYRYAMEKLRQAGLTGEGHLNIGIKKLLSVVEMARQEPEAVADRLVQALMQLAPPPGTMIV